MTWQRNLVEVNKSDGGRTLRRLGNQMQCLLIFHLVLLILVGWFDCEKPLGCKSFSWWRLKRREREMHIVVLINYSTTQQTTCWWGWDNIRKSWFPNVELWGLSSWWDDDDGEIDWISWNDMSDNDREWCSSSAAERGLTFSLLLQLQLQHDLIHKSPCFELSHCHYALIWFDYARITCQVWLDGLSAINICLGDRTK